MIYSKLIETTDAIMEGDLRLPISRQTEEKIEKWVTCKAIRIYEYRRWQLKTVGFHNCSVTSMIETMYGMKHTKQWTSEDNHKYEWTYNHHNGRNEKHKWVHAPKYYVCEGVTGFWHWPPFAQKTLWKCRVVNLNEVSCEIPPAIILKILRLQTLNVFNAFHVIEPKKSSKLPVLLGTLWELPSSEKTGYVTHFFLSEWC
jgi:hypothetical protein